MTALARLLLVDDEPDVLDVLKDHFTPMYSVDTALSGADALGSVLRERPDIVLLDINMPGMTGVDVLKAIKQYDGSIEVVMVTASDDVTLAAEALKSGAFGYVPKPFDLRYLDHMVGAILDQSRNRKP